MLLNLRYGNNFSHSSFKDFVKLLANDNEYIVLNQKNPSSEIFPSQILKGCGGETAFFFDGHSVDLDENKIRAGNTEIYKIKEIKYSNVLELCDIVREVNTKMDIVFINNMFDGVTDYHRYLINAEMIDINQVKSKFIPYKIKAVTTQKELLKIIKKLEKKRNILS